MAYQKITDIYATACDYQKNATTTQEFYAKVQNKLHWAITGKTVAEIVYSSADATKKHMGLTSWAQAPDGFLELSSYPILIDKGKVSALEARLKAYEEYDKFRVIQDREFLSDFDKEVMRLKGELGLFDN